jgi:hypothetical protein
VVGGFARATLDYWCAEVLVVYEGGVRNDWCGLCVQSVRECLCTHERRVAWRLRMAACLSKFYPIKTQERRVAWLWRMTMRLANFPQNEDGERRVAWLWRMATRLAKF